VKGTTQAIEELIQLLQNPETIKNAQTLANAMVTAFEKVLTAISKTVEFTKWLGEELASQVYGVAGDDITRLEKNLDSAKAKLKELEDGYKAVAFADKLLGKVGISTDFLTKSVVSKAQGKKFPGYKSKLMITMNRRRKASRQPLRFRPLPMFLLWQRIKLKAAG